MSSPDPVPIAPLAYQTPSDRSRPGILTAVGVISIVVGSLSSLASLLAILTTIGTIALSRMTISMPVPATMPVAPANTVSVNGIPVSPDASPDAMDEPQRQKVIDAITLIHPISEIHRQHLNLLLGNSGQKIFPFVNESTSIAEIRDKISLFTDSRLDYINTATGVIQIDNAQAIFQPSAIGDTIKANALNPTTAIASPPIITRKVPFGFSMPASILSLVESLASLVIAGVLLVAGIFLLANSQGYLRLHWIYVCTKIPLAFLATVASWLSYIALIKSLPASTTMPASYNLFMVIPSLIGLIVVLAYTIPLILVLNSRTAKIYNAELRGIRE